jgi:hypothetical protein
MKPTIWIVVTPEGDKEFHAPNAYEKAYDFWLQNKKNWPEKYQELCYPAINYAGGTLAKS